MPQSFCQLYVHLIFSTKDRHSTITPGLRLRLHAYLAEVLRDMGSAFVVVGGPDNHVHALFDLGKKLVVVDVVEHIKKESSKFVKTLGVEYQHFYWQRGYGAFSVGPTHRDEVVRYIETQEEHHKRITFQEEYRAFLIKYGIPYDEKYVWD